MSINFTDPESFRPVLTIDGNPAKEVVELLTDRRPDKGQTGIGEAGWCEARDSSGRQCILRPNHTGQLHRSD